jgi:4-amino-4-deoxy-L-arabinose transferase-like glycosyltransferase
MKLSLLRTGIYNHRYLLLIILLGSMLRLYQIGKVPLGFTWDEASITYDAWGIVDWHRDQHAKLMPLTFKSFGDYKAPLMHYILALTFFITGVQTITIRLISAIAGIALIPVTYGLCKTLFKPKTVALLSAMLMAISPWAVHLSRVGFEANTALLFISAGMLALLGSNKRNWTVMIGVLLLALSVYTYQSPKIVAPLLLGLALLHLGRLTKIPIKKVLVYAGLFLGLMIPFLISLRDGGLARGQDVLILFGEKGTFDIHTGTAVIIAKNIVTHLSPSFLYLGLQDNWRNVVPGYGIMLLVDWLFVLIGFWGLISKRNRAGGFILVWIVIGLLPSILSQDAPHMLRAVNALVPLLLLTSYGVWVSAERLYNRFKVSKHWTYLATSGVYAVFLISFLAYYFGEYKTNSALDFQYGHREALTIAQKELRTARRLWVTDSYGQPYIFTLLYFGYTPEQFQQGALANVKFARVTWPNNEEDTVFVATPEEIPPDDKQVFETIKIPGTDQVVFVIARR